MNFLEKVASFADQYTNTTETEDGVLFKVAADMDVTYADMVALHNITNANVFTGEGLEKIAEDAEPSRIAMVGDLWEKIASGEIGEEGIVMAAGEIPLEDDEIGFILTQLDKQAEEAGIEGFEAEEAGIIADDETWEKIAEVHEYLEDAGLDAMSALDFAVDMMNAEDDEASEKVAAEYEDIEDEAFDKIAEAIDYLSDTEGAYDLMESYDKEAKSIVQNVGEFLSKDRRTIKDTVKQTAKKGWEGYKKAIKGEGKKGLRKKISEGKTNISKGNELKDTAAKGHKARNEALANYKKKDSMTVETSFGGKKKTPSPKTGAKSAVEKAQAKSGKKTADDLGGRSEYLKGQEKALGKNKKALRKINTHQAAAVGGTALVAGGGAAAAYNAAKSDNN